MRLIAIVSSSILSVFFASAGNGTNKIANKSGVQQITFTENKGQVSDQFFKPRPDVLFSGSTGNMAYHLRKNGISYQLSSAAAGYRKTGDLGLVDSVAVITGLYRVDVDWVHSSDDFKVEKLQALPGYDNFYLQGCPQGVQEVKTFSGILYENIYEGIDIHYYGMHGSLKYDFIVAAGANYKQIQLKIEGAEKISLRENGSVTIATPLGDIEEGAPIVYQDKKQLEARWEIHGNFLAFSIVGYDPAREMVIDPTTRVWGTYYGGAAVDAAGSGATDSNGNVFICGYTVSDVGGTIATTGSHQFTYGGGLFGAPDAFLVKFNSAGVRQWGSYYGGTGDDFGNCCAVDNSGNIFLAGSTTSGSGNAIATPGAHQDIYGGGLSAFGDAFLVKFNTNGFRQWSTYYGGTGREMGYGCVADAAGNIYLCGQAGSFSGTTIATIGSHQSGFGGTSLTGDGFLVKFDASGVRLWGTYYGGPGGENAVSCATDATGNVYMTGYSSSTAAGTVIATSPGHQDSSGGGNDAYLVKFNGSGVRLWATFYGGSGAEYGKCCTLDPAGNIFLGGYTDSSSGTVIATTGSHQNLPGGNTDAFLVKFDAAGTRLWGTYYGGPGSEQSFCNVTDLSGNIYLVGNTDTNAGNSVASPLSFQSSFGGGNFDGFVVKLNSAGVRQWATYYGGAGDDECRGCVADVTGNLYIIGYSNGAAGTIIATLGSHQPLYAGGTGDAFLVKFSECTPPLINVVSSSSLLCEGESATLTASGGNTYYWNTLTAGSYLIISPSVNTTYTVVGMDIGGCPNASTITQLVDPCTGVSGQNIVTDYKLFPNPNFGAFFIETEIEGEIIVTNSIGNLVLKQKSSEFGYHVDLTNQLPGIYIVTIMNSRGHEAFKVIKE